MKHEIYFLCHLIIYHRYPQMPLTVLREFMDACDCKYYTFWNSLFNYLFNTNF